MQFEFKGDWVFDLELRHLSDNFTFNGLNRPPKRRDKITIEIIDVRDDAPIPAVAQINAVNFILGNQEAIVKSVFDVLVKQIMLKYKSSFDDDEPLFYEIRHKTDLQKVLGLDRIKIFNMWKNDYAYALIHFNSFRYNPEHGLNIVLHKSGFIGTHEDFKEAYEDLGINYNDVLLNMSKAHKEMMDNRTFKYYSLDGNYPRLKPWKISENEFYPFRLLHTHQPEELIRFLDDHLAELNLDIESLKNLAKNYNLNAVVEYLDKLGTD